MGHPYRTPPEDSDEPFDDDEFADLDDIDERLRDLNEAQTLWERVVYLKTMKMPCPECGGAGSLYAGSLGGTCPTCFGARMVDHPAAEEIEVPNFVDMRRALSGAAAARDQRLGLRSKDEMRLSLPDPASLPSRDAIKALADQAREIARGLPASPQIEGTLREPPRPRLHAPDDRQLDAFEDGDADAVDSGSLGESYPDDDYLDGVEDGDD